MYVIRKIFEQGQIFGVKFYFRPHGIIISIRCVGTVLCKVWGSFPGIQKNCDLDVFPVSLCLTVSTTAVGPWFRAIIHGHLSLFTYSCKPKDDNPSGDSEDYSDHFFFQWSKEGAMNYVLFTASGGVFDIFIGLLQRSKFVFLIPLRTCTMRRMQFTHLCLVLNS